MKIVCLLLMFVAGSLAQESAFYPLDAMLCSVTGMYVEAECEFDGETNCEACELGVLLLSEICDENDDWVKMPDQCASTGNAKRALKHVHQRKAKSHKNRHA